ncbi:pectin lyase-like protein [Pluteus cervinus]|uniref:Pectin lyase-like protein n=1 Tax=Pluteus cervinus TaxID=181527 RepID=A0ACD3ACE6_9AGAR|nr:pectin lyase-like protein [Pluteus cervinus]
MTTTNSKLTRLASILPFLLLLPLFTKAEDCIVPHNNDGSDDSPAILSSFTQCSINSTITFEQAEYQALTPISLVGLENVTIFLNGNIHLPTNISQVQHAINTTTNQPSTYATPWFYIHGSNVQIIGSDDSGWGRFDGHGEQWWNQGNRILRPQLATFNVTNGLLRNLKVIKPIAWDGTSQNHFVDAKPDNGTRDVTTMGRFPSARHPRPSLTFNSYYGHNGDDCISVINGARDVVVQNGFCGFSSHGLSIGSLGRDGAEQTVANVLFKNWTMEGAVYGARFKSWTGGRGWAENVTWEDIKLVNVSTGIFITQKSDKGPRPDNPGHASTRISNFKYKNFSGTLSSNWTDGTCISNPCWNYIQGIDNTRAIIFDLYPGTAVNVSVEDVDVQTSNGASSQVICDPSALASGEQASLGFKCATGPLMELDEGGKGKGKWGSDIQ